MKLLKELLSLSEGKFNFVKISYEDFDHLSLDSSDYEDTEINGKHVQVHYDKSGNVDALYYTSKRFGSYCKEIKTDDSVDFAEQDVNWPWD